MKQPGVIIVPCKEDTAKDTKQRWTSKEDKTKKTKQRRHCKEDKTNMT